MTGKLWALVNTAMNIQITHNAEEIYCV